MNNTYLLLIPMLICVIGAFLGTIIFKKDEKKNHIFTLRGIIKLNWQSTRIIDFFFFLKNIKNTHIVVIVRK